MIFTSTLFLFLLPLAGLPVLFHFLLKQKKRRLVFSTLMFFHRTDPRLSARRRLRQWLILLLRALLIGSVLMALARPVWQLTGANGGRTDQVILIDNSASMGGLSPDGRSRLEVALEGARRLITANTGAATTLMTTAPDATTTLPESLSTDRAGLLKQLDSIRVTHGAGEPAQGVQRALALLAGGPAGGGTVHILTDLQENDWKPFAAATARLSAQRCGVVIHRIEAQPQTQANGAIRAVQLPPGRLLPRHSYPVGFTIQNTSAQTLKAELAIQTSHGETRRETVTIGGHLARTVYTDIQMQNAPVAVNPDNPDEGFYWVRAELNGDGFAGDNEAGAALYCSGRATVLLVGQPDTFGLLPAALSPGGKGSYTGLLLAYTTPEELTEGLAKHQPVMVVLGWQALAAMHRADGDRVLEEFVRAGGNLLIAPDGRTKQEPAGDLMTSWLAAGSRAEQTAKSGLRLSALERRARFWQSVALQQRSGGTLADGFTQESIRAARWQPLQLTAAYDPLLGGDYDSVILAERRLGRGAIYLAGIGFDRSWSTLPASGLMVILAQRMALSSLEQSTPPAQAVVMTAGPLPPLGLTGSVQMVSLAGDTLEWRGEINALKGLARSGIYLLAAGENRACLAVRPNDQEGIDRYYEAAGGNAMPLENGFCRIQPFELETLTQPQWLDRFAALDLYGPLLLLAALALLGEGLLANPRIKTDEPSHPDMAPAEIQPAEAWREAL